MPTDREEMYREFLKCAGLFRPKTLKQVFTDEEYDTLRQAMYGTWNRIAGDVGVFSSRDATELTIDNGYMSIHGYREGELLVDALCAEYGFKRACDLLQTDFPL